MDRRLVIDASVASSAGGPDASASVSKRCRDLLDRMIDDTDHYIVLTSDIRSEWREHASRSARGWLREMVQSNRIVALEDVDYDVLRQAIEAYAPQEGVADLMQKDRHLIEAALETDLRILSLDDQVRAHFSRSCDEINLIQDVLWANPRPPDEECIDWIVMGTPREDERLLCEYIS